MKPTGLEHLSDQALDELEIAHRNKQRQENRTLSKIRREKKRRQKERMK